MRKSNILLATLGVYALATSAQAGTTNSIQGATTGVNVGAYSSATQMKAPFFRRDGSAFHVLKNTSHATNQNEFPYIFCADSNLNFQADGTLAKNLEVYVGHQMTGVSNLTYSGVDLGITERLVPTSSSRTSHAGERLEITQGVPLVTYTFGSGDTNNYTLPDFANSALGFIAQRLDSRGFVHNKGSPNPDLVINGPAYSFNITNLNQYNTFPPAPKPVQKPTPAPKPSTGKLVP